MTKSSQVVRDNLSRVQERMAAAAARSGRSRDDVTLVAVTKYIPAELILPLVEAGCRIFAENRPQELWKKAAVLQQMLAPDMHVEWHLIGHLQRNKIARTWPLVTMIESVDSDRLLMALDDAITPGNRLRVLLEANVSGDSNKTGLAPNDLLTLASTLQNLKHVCPVGLMGMASFEGGADQARRDFQQLRKLRDQAQEIAPPEVLLTELSMGMSGDFEIAIEEGATIVRLGSILFEGAV